MKTLNHILVAAAAVVTFNVALSAQAVEPLLSPRAKSNLSPIVTGSSVGGPNLVKDRPFGNAKLWESARSSRMALSSGRSIDVVHAPRPTLSPKDPRFEAAWRENAVKQFQVAPLK